MLLNTHTNANMQLTINSFLQLFPEKLFYLTFTYFPDISLTAVKIPNISRFSRQVVTLYITRHNLNRSIKQSVGKSINRQYAFISNTSNARQTTQQIKFLFKKKQEKYENVEIHWHKSQNTLKKISTPTGYTLSHIFIPWVYTVTV